MEPRQCAQSRSMFLFTVIPSEQKYLECCSFDLWHYLNNLDAVKPTRFASSFDAKSFITKALSIWVSNGTTKIVMNYFRESHIVTIHAANVIIIRLMLNIAVCWKDRQHLCNLLFPEVTHCCFYRNTSLFVNWYEGIVILKWHPVSG